jgi:hypothetical protein
MAIAIERVFQPILRKPNSAFITMPNPAAPMRCRYPLNVLALHGTAVFVMTARLIVPIVSPRRTDQERYDANAQENAVHKSPRKGESLPSHTNHMIK